MYCAGVHILIEELCQRKIYHCIDVYANAGVKSLYAVISLISQRIYVASIVLGR